MTSPLLSSLPPVHHAVSANRLSLPQSGAVIRRSYTYDLPNNLCVPVSRRPLPGLPRLPNMPRERKRAKKERIRHNIYAVYMRGPVALPLCVSHTPPGCPSDRSDPETDARYPRPRREKCCTPGERVRSSFVQEGLPKVNAGASLPSRVSRCSRRVSRRTCTCMVERVH